MKRQRYSRTGALVPAAAVGEAAKWELVAVLILMARIVLLPSIQLADSTTAG